MQLSVFSVDLGSSYSSKVVIHLVMVLVWGGALQHQPPLCLPDRRIYSIHLKMMLYLK